MIAAHPMPARDDDEVLTWRDALTPLARASRQRWATAFVLLLCTVAATPVWPDTLGRNGDATAAPLAGVAGLLVIFGMLRRGTRRMAAMDHPELDERDLAARDRAFRLAYPLLLIVALGTLLALFAALPAVDRTEGGRVDGGFFLNGGALTGLVAWLAVWGVFLPTAILAWREPDALALDDVPDGHRTELLRDAILGAGLVASFVLSLLADSDGWVLLLVATIAALGGAARGAAGQPVMSRQRQIRVAIGLALLAACAIAVLLTA